MSEVQKLVRIGTVSIPTASAPTEEETPVITTGVRLDLEAKLNDRIEEWARKERRSKREHITYMVEELLETYEQAPEVLKSLWLLRQGKARLVPA